MARMLRGQPLADKIAIDCGVQIFALKDQGFSPSLSSVLVGNEKVMAYLAEQIHLICGRVTMGHHTEHFGEYAGQDSVISCIEELNEDPDCDGIYVARPMPEGMDHLALLSAVNPGKDVSGLHPQNLGLTLEGYKQVPDMSDAMACMMLIAEAKVNPSGKKAVVAGRNRSLCGPVAAMLTKAGATVTTTHGAAPGFAGICRGADILVVSEDTPDLVTGAMIKPGSVVIDAGIIYKDEKFNGNVELKSAARVAKYISPIPGGFEMLSVALTMRNALHLSMRHEGAKRRAKKASGASK